MVIVVDRRYGPRASLIVGIDFWRTDNLTNAKNLE